MSCKLRQQRRRKLSPFLHRNDSYFTGWVCVLGEVSWARRRVFSSPSDCGKSDCSSHSTPVGSHCANTLTLWCNGQKTIPDTLLLFDHLPLTTTLSRLSSRGTAAVRSSFVCWKLDLPPSPFTVGYNGTTVQKPWPGGLQVAGRQTLVLLTFHP